MVVIKCRIISKPREGTRHIYRIRNDDGEGKSKTLLILDLLVIMKSQGTQHGHELERYLLSLACEL